MIIQWFPGHMTKALRMMEEQVKLVESVVYVLDARAAEASINPSFDRFLKNKTVVYVLNKSDLSDDSVNKRWIRAFERQNRCIVSVCGASGGSVTAVKNALRSLNEPLLTAYKNKGVNKTVRAMVIGIPNCGKSTIINSLCGTKRAATGDKAGVTKGKQWVKIDSSLELLDTPGTLCPAFEDQRIGLHLGYIGSVNDLIVDRESLALELIKELKQLYPNALAERYEVNTAVEPLEIFDGICKKRGFILRGGEFDYERGAIGIIDDFRKGRLGKISLESPQGV